MHLAAEATSTPPQRLRLLFWIQLFEERINSMAAPRSIQALTKLDFRSRNVAIASALSQQDTDHVEHAPKDEKGAHKHERKTPQTYS